MDKFITLGGNVVGLAGVLMTVAAGAVRVSGQFYLGGFETMTLFVGGMGLMLIGALAKLHVLTNQRG